MTKTPLDYSQSGVDYSKIDPLKLDAQRAARETAGNLARVGYKEVPASRGESAYVVDMGPFYLASITECLGTKVIVAEAMRKIAPQTRINKTYYDALAQDTLAMAINDIITVGATPISVHAYWAAGGSDWFTDSARTADLVQGWKDACDRSGVSWGGGETPSLGGIVADGMIDLAASCVGVINPKERLTLGDSLAPGDVIILLPSSGIHSNGVSLARKLAETLPLGYATPIGDGRLYGDALLDATVLYSPATEALFAAGIIPRYAANITGHGWRKMMRHTATLTYRMIAVPSVPPVLSFIQKEAGIDDHEAYSTFNMGAGFALYLSPADAGPAMDVLQKAGFNPLRAGMVEAGDKRVVIEPLGLTFTEDDLKLRA